MPIINQELWDKQVAINTEPYSKAIIDVARVAMQILDDAGPDFNCYDIIIAADKQSDAGGLTGFMAGCVAVIISKVHSRGEEFRRKWNVDNQIGDEGEKANESGGVINPAIMTKRVTSEDI